MCLQFVTLECLMTSVTDMFPTVFRKGYRRELLLLGLCSVCFFLGLLLVTEVGILGVCHTFCFRGQMKTMLYFSL